MRRLAVGLSCAVSLKPSSGVICTVSTPRVRSITRPTDDDSGLVSSRAALACNRFTLARCPLSRARNSASRAR